jgi:hypothetical protein
MCFNDVFITRLTVVAELKKRINVFAERLKLETPFTDAATICIRGFFMSKISGFKRLFPDSLRVDKGIEQKKQALSSPDNLHHNNGIVQRVMTFFVSCEHLRGSRRLIVGTGNMSTLNALHGQ